MGGDCKTHIGPGTCKLSFFPTSQILYILCCFGPIVTDRDSNELFSIKLLLERLPDSQLLLCSLMGARRRLADDS